MKGAAFIPQTLITLICSLIFSGCSLPGFFSQLTRTQEEQGAAEAVQNAQLLNQRRQDLQVEARQYDYSTQLMPIKTSASGLVFVFLSHSDNQTHYTVKGYISSPQEGEYHVWATNDPQDRFVDLGPVEFNDAEQFSLSHSLEGTNLGLTSIVFSLDASDSAKPKDPQLAGMLIKSR